MNLSEIVSNRYHKGIGDCSNEELYYALLEMTKNMAAAKESNEGKRKLYIIHQQPKYNSGQTLTIGRASLYLFPR